MTQRSGALPSSPCYTFLLLLGVTNQATILVGPPSVPQGRLWSEFLVLLGFPFPFQIFFPAFVLTFWAYSLAFRMCACVCVCVWRVCVCVCVCVSACVCVCVCVLLIKHAVRECMCVCVCGFSGTRRVCIKCSGFEMPPLNEHHQRHWLGLIHLSG